MILLHHFCGNYFNISSDGEEDWLRVLKIVKEYTKLDGLVIPPNVISCS
ncbi:hypothetical protein XSR1_100056 [Xenorhabdus szentirmaii DSM 16338]|uniref:Uncharacterized protein n=1 Tax=Xenorhabdus szentirmaii DSM 16338 TaxID=1427518 RepID=W1IRB0_9GAMM|nr:hypothetical protein XSR1_100056 [Xenorhabdus szentirmaii DSM 16338]